MPCFSVKLGFYLTFHYKPVKNCPNHVRRAKSSIKKRIIVRRTVRNMFGEKTVRPLENELKGQVQGFGWF